MDECSIHEPMSILNTNTIEGPGPGTGFVKGGHIIQKSADSNIARYRQGPLLPFFGRLSMKKKHLSASIQTSIPTSFWIQRNCIQIVRLKASVPSLERFAQPHSTRRLGSKDTAMTMTPMNADGGERRSAKSKVILSIRKVMHICFFQVESQVHQHPVNGLSGAQSAAAKVSVPSSSQYGGAATVGGQRETCTCVPGQSRRGHGKGQARPGRVHRRADGRIVLVCAERCGVLE
ncbi:uncharacterized protein FOMMEDRAFT_147925 [Fomitiporia mediterranea MF3/22]|uniref:uncharacterized protein n=1 Tax=Fomitiporia mediterranea (strain MF3/22) TaxID=694068 RepID=UPI0004408DCB|nr:uncharacterized protein FOMMEDRAFT_147925 [Fomitiporia mediterranea MF3/22]EJD01382.1 hypothetical protein FOMMEDRAFT_147925 [Fomitiporia mediterranea MF3/22]